MIIESEELLIKLPTLSDSRGSLSFLEGGKHIPFEIKRIYYLYDIPNDSERGAHAHRKLKQYIISLSGSFDIIFNDGFNQKTFHLENPAVGLYIPPMVWHELNHFSDNTICLVLASDHYDESDYFRDYSEFLASVKTIG